ncbi:MAG: HDOD domain-containing protein [bacterium]
MIEGLPKELSGKIELPGFPDIANRLNQAMCAESPVMKDIVALINSEPALVSSLMRLANSAAFNTSNVNISELKTAITRLGFNIVWSAANSFAMRQMQQQEWLQPLRPWLAEIWLSSNSVGAICFVLAKRLRVIKADEALTVGLFHRVGDLYLLTHAHKKGIDLHNNPAWDRAVVKWQATVASAIVRQWGLPGHVAESIQQQDDLVGPRAGELLPYARLLSAAKLYNSIRDRQGTKQASEAAAALEDADLWGVSFLDLVADCNDEIDKMRHAIA